MKLANAILIALSAIALSAQEHRLSASINGVTIDFVTRLEPPGTVLPGGILVDAVRVHHFITDDAHKRYTGYDVFLDAASDGQTVQLRLQPLSVSRQRAEVSGYERSLPPKLPTIPRAHIGETIAIDLLVNPATGQKIVDYLTLRRGVEGTKEAPRDFEEKDIEMFLDGPQIFVDGTLAEATAHYEGAVSAPVVWFYLPGHGRFLISLFPNATLGFQKAGMVTDSSMKFRGGGSEYRLECRRRIAPGGGLYNIYILHEPAWRFGAEPFAVGGADKAEYIVHK